jgi:hypothetical protein
MSTRSRIAVEIEEGKVISAYCHSDGYLSGVGKDLMSVFPDGTEPEKIREYVRKGDRTNINLTYQEWRDEKCPPKNHKSVDTFFNGDIEEYGYLFTAEGEWLVKKASSNEKDPVPLAYALSETIKL